MKCFNHQDRDAFGICKSCGRGLCLDCMGETDGVIVYKDNPLCTQMAHNTHITLLNSASNYSKQNIIINKMYAWALMLSGMFTIFIGYKSGLYLFSLIGFVVFIFGIGSNSKISRIKSSDEKEINI